MVLILDGNSEHVTHVKRKTLILFKFASSVDLDKCLKQVILSISRYTCAPISELPSYISTMVIAYGHDNSELNCIIHGCCCCLPCNHCSNWTWLVEEVLAFGNRLRYTHCREFHYMKPCRPAYLHRTIYLWSIKVITKQKSIYEQNFITRISHDISELGCIHVLF